jgi:hypothetical protein
VSPCERFMRRLSASCSLCSSRVLLCLPFDPFCQWVFGARGLADGPWVEYGRSVCGGQSAGKRRAIRFSRCVSGGSGSYFGRSVVTLWTVRAFLADSPPGPYGRSTLSTADCLNPSLVELRFRVALSWDLFLGLVGPL